MVPHLSFIIPAYNEETRIAHSLPKAVSYFAEQSYTTELIVVDDGSRDRTVDVVRSFAGVKVLQNRGKGAAVRRGMLESTGAYRIFSDADFSTPVHETAKVLQRLEQGAEVCIGSRALDETYIKVHQPWYRERMGKLFNFFVQSLLFKGISDTQCGFKGLTAQAAEKIFRRTKIDGFGFDVEMLYLARTMNLKIDQVPVEWYNDDRTTVNPLTDASRMFFELLSIKRLHRNG
jgi:dolichyl-phosphate beta-glucosyltransferase